jgi:hypothetical protein
MLRQDEHVEARSAITAYTQTLRWLHGTKVNDCSSQDHRLWICGLSRGSRKAWLVWNTTGAGQWEPPTDWHALQYETLDARLLKAYSNTAISVGSSPILVQSDTKLWSAY